MTCHIQIFYGRCPPGSTEPRTAAVVWSGDTVLDQGPVEEMRGRFPDAVERTDIQVWLDLKSLRKLGSPVGNPFGNPMTEIQQPSE